MIRNKHLRISQEKIEKAKKIFKARTETEALDLALDKVIHWDQSRLQRRKLLHRINELRSSIGKIPEDSTDWIRLARKERMAIFNDRGH